MTLVGGSRRSKGSSDDDESSFFPVEFINEDLRASGPYLVPVPVENKALPRNSPLKVLEEEPHRSKIYSILSQLKMDIREHGMMLRQAKNYPGDLPSPTLLFLKRKITRNMDWLDSFWKFTITPGARDFELLVLRLLRLPTMELSGASFVSRLSSAIRSTHPGTTYAKQSYGFNGLEHLRMLPTRIHHRAHLGESTYRAGYCG